MFKKKLKPEQIQESEEKVIKYKPLFHDVSIISYAINILNDALKTGQLVYPSRYSYDKNSLALVVLESPLPLSEGPYIDISRVQKLESFEIKSKQEIDAQEKIRKSELLAKLKESHARTVSEIEQLARELGENN